MTSIKEKGDYMAGVIRYTKFSVYDEKLDEWK